MSQVSFSWGKRSNTKLGDDKVRCFARWASQRMSCALKLELWHCMRQWTSRNRILNSKPFLLELISTQLIRTHTNTPTCLMPADSLKNLVHQCLSCHPLPSLETLGITMNTLKEKQWPFKKLGHDHESHRVHPRHPNHHCHFITHPNTKIWVNALSKNYELIQWRWGGKGSLPVQKIFSERLLWVRHSYFE